MHDHAAVRRLLPQRHPLLLVDRVLELRPGQSIRTTKAVSGTDPCYAGVPEGAALSQFAYPRSLIIESFGQSAALLWLAGTTPDLADGRVLMFVGASDYRFFGSAYPGDILRHEVKLDSVIADTAFASGETWIGDRLVSSVSNLLATLRPVPRLGPDSATQQPPTPSVASLKSKGR